MKASFLTLASAALTASIVGISAPAQAFSFGSGGIQFDQDTSVEFTFDQSHGAYTSSLWVYSVENSALDNGTKLFYETKQSDNSWENEWKGTFGNAVTSTNGQVTQVFNFLKDKVYALVLYSDAFSGNPFQQSVTSTTALNPTGTQQAVLGNFNLNYGSTSPFSAANGGKGADQFAAVSLSDLVNGVKISFDDRGNGNDADFQDFTVFAKAASNTESVPEPASMAGLMLVGGAIAASRRKRAV
ncbi:MAG TPA: PEP-CTERM sorting domain-containing protein [Chroococcidiopsis sp.]